MRQKYMIRCWNKLTANKYGGWSFGHDDYWYSDSSFLTFLWHLWKAYRKYKYIQVDIMLTGQENEAS